MVITRTIKLFLSQKIWKNGELKAPSWAKITSYQLGNREPSKTFGARLKAGIRGWMVKHQYRLDGKDLKTNKTWDKKQELQIITVYISRCAPVMFYTTFADKIHTLLSTQEYSALNSSLVLKDQSVLVSSENIRKKSAKCVSCISLHVCGQIFHPAEPRPAVWQILYCFLWLKPELSKLVLHSQFQNCHLH